MLDIFFAFLGFSAGTIVSAMVMSLKFKKQVPLLELPSRTESVHRWYVTGADHQSENHPSRYVVQLRRHDNGNWMNIGFVDILEDNFPEKLHQLVLKADDIARTLNVVEEDMTPSKKGLST